MPFGAWLKAQPILAYAFSNFVNRVALRICIVNVLTSELARGKIEFTNAPQKRGSRGLRARLLRRQQTGYQGYERQERRDEQADFHSACLSSLLRNYGHSVEDV